MNPLEPYSAPQSSEAEFSVLGSMLYDPTETLDRCMELLTPDHFYNRSNRLIFEAIKEMVASGSPIDPITVSSHLKAHHKLDEVGGPSYVSSLTRNPLGAHSGYFIAILVEKLRLRRILDFVESFKFKAMASQDSNELLPTMEAELFAISGDVVSNDNKTASAVIELDKQVKQRMEGGTVFGVSSGIPSFDLVTGGLMPGRYYALAALQKVGKTALGCQIALNVVLSGKPVLFISLELSADRLLGRMAACDAQVSYFKYLNNTMDPRDLLKFQQSYRKIGNAPFIIERSVDITGAKIRSIIRKHKRKSGIELVVIDYIQNVAITDGDVRRSIADASTSVRNACQETGVPAITICQLNRSAANEDRPRMFHLRESSQIESDADTIILLFPKVDRDTLQPNELLPMVMAFDANRDGPACDQELLYDGSCYTFKELPKTFIR